MRIVLSFKPFQNHPAPDAVKRSPMLLGATDNSGE
jgi:hypothetical protein